MKQKVISRLVAEEVRKFQLVPTATPVEVTAHAWNSLQTEDFYLNLRNTEKLFLAREVLRLGLGEDADRQTKLAVLSLVARITALHDDIVDLILVVGMKIPDDTHLLLDAAVGALNFMSNTTWVSSLMLSTSQVGRLIRACLIRTGVRFDNQINDALKIALKKGMAESEVWKEEMKRVFGAYTIPERKVYGKLICELSGASPFDLPEDVEKVGLAAGARW